MEADQGIVTSNSFKDIRKKFQSYNTPPPNPSRIASSESKYNTGFSTTNDKRRHQQPIKHQESGEEEEEEEEGEEEEEEETPIVEAKKMEDVQLDQKRIWEDNTKEVHILERNTDFKTFSFVFCFLLVTGCFAFLLMGWIFLGQSYDLEENITEAYGYSRKQQQQQHRHPFLNKYRRELELHSWLNNQTNTHLTSNHFICAHNIPKFALEYNDNDHDDVVDSDDRTDKITRPKCGVPLNQLQLTMHLMTNTFEYFDKNTGLPRFHISVRDGRTDPMNLPEYWITERMTMVSNSHAQRIVLGIFDDTGNVSAMVGNQDVQDIQQLHEKYKHHISFRETPPYCSNFQRYSWWVPTKTITDSIQLGSAYIRVTLMTFLEYSEIFQVNTDDNDDNDDDDDDDDDMMKRFLNAYGSIPLKVSLTLLMNGTHVSWDKGCIEDRRILTGEKESSLMESNTEICFTLNTEQVDAFHMLYWQLLNALEDHDFLSENKNSTHWCTIDN